MVDKIPFKAEDHVKNESQPAHKTNTNPPFKVVDSASEIDNNAIKAKKEEGNLAQDAIKDSDPRLKNKKGDTMDVTAPMTAAEAAEFDFKEQQAKNFFKQNNVTDINPYKYGSAEYQREEDRKKKLAYDEQNLLADKIKLQKHLDADKPLSDSEIQTHTRKRKPVTVTVSE